jgi:hypothetical protein
MSVFNAEKERQMNRDNAGTSGRKVPETAGRRFGGDMPIGETGKFPAELYGVLTQILLYVRTMDKDYEEYLDKELDG